MDWNRVADIFAGALLSTAFATAVIYRIETKRRPNLRIEIEEPKDVLYPPDRPARRARYLVFNILNEPLHRPWQWLSREVAMRCTASASFYHLDDGQDVFGRSISLRWSSSPQPGVPKLEAAGVVGEEGDRDKKPIHLFRIPGFSTEPQIDIYPGSREELAVAARFNDEDDAFGWSNENYVSKPPWRNPEVKLPGGRRYLVKVTIKCINAKEESSVYRVLNDVSVRDFRLQVARSSDRIDA